MAKLKHPKKPALKKYPRKPKGSASSQVLHSWLDKKTAVDHHNRQRLFAYSQACKAVEHEKHLREVLRKKIASAGSPADVTARKTSLRKCAPRKSASRKVRKSAPKKTASRRKTARRK